MHATHNVQMRKMVLLMLDRQKDKLFLIFSTRGKEAELFIVPDSLAAKEKTVGLSFGH